MIAGADHDNPLVTGNTVHLLEQSIDDRAPPVIALLPTTPAAERIQLVDEQNTRCAKPRLSKGAVNGGSKPGRRGGVKTGHWIVT